MNTQKVCLSKQTTFIVLVFALLLGYVLFTYRTMINKNSTNSRASTSTKTAQVNKMKIPTPDCEIEVCQYIYQQPVVSEGDGTAEFVSVVKNNGLDLRKNTQYAVFINQVAAPSTRAKLLYVGNQKEVVRYLQTDIRIDKFKFTSKNVIDFQFYITEVTQPNAL